MKSKTPVKAIKFVPAAEVGISLVWSEDDKYTYRNKWGFETKTFKREADAAKYAEKLSAKFVSKADIKANAAKVVAVTNKVVKVVKAAPTPEFQAPSNTKKEVSMKATKPTTPAKPLAKPAAPGVPRQASATPKAAPKVAAKPVAAKPVAAKPVAAKPVAAKPVAAKPVAAKPVAAKPVAKAAPQDNTKYKVGDDSAVKRGVVREFVDAAKALKVFTRDVLVAKMLSAYDEERMTRYFYYCTGKSIFVAA